MSPSPEPVAPSPELEPIALEIVNNCVDADGDLWDLERAVSILTRHYLAAKIEMGEQLLALEYGDRVGAGQIRDALAKLREEAK